MNTTTMSYEIDYEASKASNAKSVFVGRLSRSPRRLSDIEDDSAFLEFLDESRLCGWDIWNISTCSSLSDGHDHSLHYLLFRVGQKHCVVRWEFSYESDPCILNIEVFPVSMNKGEKI